MRARLLGTGAGGGFPQWNCACRGCERARARHAGTRVRTQSSLALNANGTEWYLVDATPDVRVQVEAFPLLRPGPGLRQTPIRGILLTDAELDHTVGLLVLREGAELTVHSTATVREALSGPFPVREMLRPYATLEWIEVRPGASFVLDGGRIRAVAFRTGSKAPRYVGSAVRGDGWSVGYRFEDTSTGGALAYVPGLEAWTPEVEEHLAGTGAVFLDGTFWSDDELVALHASESTAREMGHLPMTGPGGTARRLAELAVPLKAYVHVNNTNPVLREDGPEYRFLASLGIGVGWDGLEVEL
ncbi:pyrroloquinoline quinone biosynthesis protein PqqB [Limnochorda pilosa]|uniref:Coenzyme PQQ synthesis protein B n=1 Tax=Limnochorda pilosa TaxID=1555112 RepID=A0A0K2SIQ6_LIMPI|nr:pyrroloquinoline quinone biosynthesis protein PqqB [Limnochorda pilosa]BAS26993.1 hypothetical protein LIP_1136 [Limnochorda pilosa]